MAIVYPRTDVIENVGVVSQTFQLMSRGEYARMANGVTISKRMGSAIWIAEWTSKDKLHNKAIDFEAIIHSLDDGIGEFLGYDTRRPMPLEYPTGNFNDTGQIRAISSSGNTIGFQGLTPGTQFRRGDYFCFTYGDGDIALHQLMEDQLANVSGNTVQGEVRPLIRVGATVGTPVIFKNPYAKFRLFPQQTTFATANILQSSASIKAFQVFQ